MLLSATTAFEFDAEIGDDAAMMSRYLARFLAAAWVACAALPVVAAENETGRDIAAACASCHHGGPGSGAAIPDLAGMAKATIVSRMREFRDGSRPSTIMRQLANGYTDAQIEAAASYLSVAKPR